MGTSAFSLCGAGLWIAASLSGCGGAGGAAVDPRDGAAGAPHKPQPLVSMVTPSRLVPEVDERHTDAWLHEPGRRVHLVSGLRIVVHDDGQVARADERFPNGAVEAVPLPDRLGGGFVFFQSDSQGTRLWRADTWIGKLTGMSYIGPSTAEVMPGFDRLYLRTRSNKLMALDAQTGAVMPLGSLPASTGLGVMAFVDGWRALVDSDVRGPMITFDAGASWRPLPIEERVVAVGALDGDPVVYVDRGHYRIDDRGQVQLVKQSDVAPDGDLPMGDEGDEDAVRGEHPLGARPLRTLLERGYPDSQTSALVVHRGKLIRAHLPSARVLSINPEAFDDETARCHGVRVGAGIGFVCGAEAGETTIVALEPPLGLRVVARFAEPRFVSASGNGALVVRGSCGDLPAGGESTRSYCIVGVDGSEKEIAVRGEIGSERVVALADGRAVVLVPPRVGRAGRITVVDGDKLTSHDLGYPNEPARAVKIARRGLWLEGFQQQGKDAIAGWVEAGGPAVGVTVKLDGKVEVGTVYDEGGQLLVSGKFALAIGDGESAFESTDGGKSWNELELPRLPDSPGDAKTRGCSPVGCALRGWLRVGWGKPAAQKDLQNVEQPESVSVRALVRPPLRLGCSLASKPAQAKDVQVGEDGAPFSAWAAFRGVPAPKLGKDEIGIDKASQLSDAVATHAYVWGPKGADWTRAGWWQLRFEDRFAVEGSVRQSALTRSPWSDENSASEAIGARHRNNYFRWEANMDPAGDGAIANLCSGSKCDPFAVSDGRPIVAIRQADQSASEYRKPVEHGVARIGETWYMLSEVPGAPYMSLWRAEVGIMSLAVQLRRLDTRRFPVTTTPKLVRRAHGNELGLLIEEPPDPATGSHVGSWHVIPLDPATGELGEPALLGPSDLDGKVPRLCEEHDDGWMVDTDLSVAPAIDLDGVSGYLDDVELRLRLDPGGACLVGIAAQAGRPLAIEGRAGATGIPLSVRERGSARRWHLACTAH